MSRRTLLARAAVITGASIAASLPASHYLASPAYAAGRRPSPLSVKEAVRRAQDRTRRVRTGKTSRNGWEMERAADNGGSIFTRPVAGTPLSGIAVRMGTVETLLVHVARRFHYEVDELREGDVVGWRAPGTVRKGLAESNQASGTAIQVRPGHCPSGTRGGFFTQQERVVRDILAELEGVVRWGGDDRTPDESLFYISVGPDDKRLAKVADKIWTWNHTPGRGSGVMIDPMQPARRSRAERLAAVQA
ncbi:hypothetical protein [Streptomyces sp. NPDC005244]|uniref:hypothetical protein n=1 Tax=Streptomyces sp. NPDC005244 TaxID=3364708 RepID=UPI0036783649